MLKIKRVFGSLQNDKKKKAMLTIAITAVAVGSLVGSAAAQEFIAVPQEATVLLEDGMAQQPEMDSSGETVLAAVTVESEASEASLASVLAAYGQYDDLVEQGTTGDVSGETVLAAVTVESEASEASLASVRAAYTKYIDMLGQA